MFTLASEKLRRVDDAESGSSGPDAAPNLAEAAKLLQEEHSWLQTPVNFELARLAVQAIPAPRGAGEAVRTMEVDFCKALGAAMTTTVRLVIQEKTPNWGAQAKMLVYLMSEIQRSLVQDLLETGAKSRKEDVKRVKHLALCAETLLNALVNAARLEEFDTDQDENREFCECLLGSCLEFSKIFIGRNSEKTVTAPLMRVTGQAVEAIVTALPYFRAAEFISGRLTSLCGTYQSAAGFSKVLLEMLGPSSEVAKLTLAKMLQIDYTDTRLLTDQVTATAMLIEHCANHGNLYKLLLVEPNFSLLQGLFGVIDIKIRIAAVHSIKFIVMHLLKGELTAENVEVIESLVDLLCSQSTDVNWRARKDVVRALDELCKMVFEMRLPRMQSRMIEVACARVKDRNSLVRQTAVNLFCQILLRNIYVNDPSVEQSQQHLDSATFSEQLELVQREEKQLEEELQRVMSELKVDLSPIIKPEPEEEEASDSQESAQASEAQSTGPDASIAEASLEDTSFDVLNAAMSRAELEGPSRALTAAREAYLVANQTRQWLEDAKGFAIECEAVIEWSEKLLYSPLASDQLALIDLYTHAEVMRIKGYVRRRNSLLHLAWLKPDTEVMGLSGTGRAARVSNMLTMMFESAWLSHQEPKQKAYSLVQVVAKAERVQLLSIKKILETMIGNSRQGSVAGHAGRTDWDQLVSDVWGLFERGNESTTKDYQFQASVAQLLAFFAEIEPQYALPKLDLIFAMAPPKGSNDPKLCNYDVYTHCCEILTYCGPLLDEQERVDYLQKLGALLLRPSNSMSWFRFAHQAIHAVVRLKDIHALGALVQRFGKVLSEPASNSEEASQSASHALSDDTRQFFFAQMMYVVGDAMLHMQAELDSLTSQFKAAVTAESGKRAAALAQAQNRGRPSNEDDEQDLVQQRQTADFQFKLQIETVRKHDTLLSKLSLFEMFAPKLGSLSEDILFCEAEVKRGAQTERYSPFVQVAVISSLAKFMTANLEFCRDYMPCLLGLLNVADSEDLKSTVMVGIADNAAQNGYVTENYIPMVFDSLKQKNSTDIVKRTTTAVLTFLILGGKVKIRGKLGEMANLLVDDNPKIRALARIFFSEFAKKDTDFLNSFLDIYSSVAGMVGLQLGVKKAQEIFTFLSTLFKSAKDRLETLLKMQKEFYKIASRSMKKSSDNEFAVFKTCIEMIAKLPGRSEDDEQEEAPAATAATAPGSNTAGAPAASKKLRNLLDDERLADLKTNLDNKSFIAAQQAAQRKRDDQEMHEHNDDEYNTTAAADRSVRRTSSRISGMGVGTVLENVESEDELNEVEEHVN